MEEADEKFWVIFLHRIGRTGRFGESGIADWLKFNG